MIVDAATSQLHVTGNSAQYMGRNELFILVKIPAFRPKVSEDSSVYYANLSLDKALITGSSSKSRTYAVTPHLLHVAS